MNTAPQITSTEKMFTEKEALWKEHAKRQRESGLSRVAYCRKYQLSYDQFGYWVQKWRQQSAPARLLPINLSNLPTTISIPKTQPLCTLTFKNGHELKIHDKSVLPMLLSLWS